MGENGRGVVSFSVGYLQYASQNYISNLVLIQRHALTIESINFLFFFA